MSAAAGHNHTERQYSIGHMPIAGGGGALIPRSYRSGTGRWHKRKAEQRREPPETQRESEMKQPTSARISNTGSSLAPGAAVSHDLRPRRGSP